MHAFTKIVWLKHALGAWFGAQRRSEGLEDGLVDRIETVTKVFHLLVLHLETHEVSRTLWLGEQWFPVSIPEIMDVIMIHDGWHVCRAICAVSFE